MWPTRSGNRVDAYELEPPAHPVIDEVAAGKTTANSTELSAQINPVGETTTFAFRYDTGGSVPAPGEPCESSTSEEGLLEGCFEVPAGGGLAGSGFGDRAVSAPVTGLEPGTTYRYTVSATNSLGTVVSAEQHLTTQVVGEGFSLPDARQWQMVSPPEKNGALIEPLPKEGGTIQAAEDGAAITYNTTGPIEGAEVNRGPEFAQWFSRRGASSWSTKDISTPQEAAGGARVGVGSEYKLFTGDLEEAMVVPVWNEKSEKPPLSAEATEDTIYKRNTQACDESSPNCFTPLVTGANAPPNTAFGTKLEFLYATPDMQHVLLHSEVALDQTPTKQGGIYEWGGGALKLVNLLPEGAVAPGAVLGSKFVYRHSISGDGRRVFFSTYPTAKPEHLYMRDTVLGKTIALDTPESGVTVGAAPDPVFQTASANGLRVFFTDPQKLTTNSTARENKPDLYVCEVQYTGETPSCSLTDLTAHAGEPAWVQGEIPGASEDGSVVYFVADGVLATGATPGTCLPQSGTIFEQPNVPCNIYMERMEGTTWQAPKFVGVVSQQDDPDWQSTQLASADLSGLTSSVSPDGRFMSFMSLRTPQLVGYNNADSSTGEPDEEVLVYDASGEGSLHCASCNPSGSRPHGVFDTEESGEGLGLVAERPELWNERWLAADVPGWTASDNEHAIYQSRYLSDGRIFFNSADSLAPQDTNGKMDVYEWEMPGVGSCTESSTQYSSADGGCVFLVSSGTSARESAFLDASTNGNDVFFLTAAPLSGRDEDTAFDLYDAAVCGQEGSSACIDESAPPPPPPPCNSEASCRPETGSGGGSATPGTLSPAGSGNVPKQEVLPSVEEKKAGAAETHKGTAPRKITEDLPQETQQAPAPVL